MTQREDIGENWSSSIYKVIRPVLNFLFFFTIRFHKYKKALKSTKKHQKALKSTKKHQKAPKGTKK